MLGQAGPRAGPMPVCASPPGLPAVLTTASTRSSAESARRRAAPRRPLPPVRLPGGVFSAAGSFRPNAPRCGTSPSNGRSPFRVGRRGLRARRPPASAPAPPRLAVPLGGRRLSTACPGTHRRVSYRFRRIPDRCIPDRRGAVRARPARFSPPAPLARRTAPAEPSGRTRPLSRDGAPSFLPTVPRRVLPQSAICVTVISGPEGLVRTSATPSGINPPPQRILP